MNLLFLTTNLEKCNFNFQKKVRLPLTIQINVKIDKILLINLMFEI